MTTPAESPDHPPRRSALTLLPLVVGIVLCGATVISTAVVRDLVADQQHRLLAQRTEQIAEQVRSSARGLASTFNIIGAIYLIEPGRPVAFDTIAHSTLRGSVTAIGVAQAEGDRMVVRDEANSGSTRTELSGARLAAARRALARHDLASVLVTDVRTGKPALFRAVGSATGLVTFIESRNTPGAGFSAVRIRSAGVDSVLYASTTPDAHSIVSHTGPAHLEGQVIGRPVDSGSDHWYLVTAARGSLVGSFAPVVPWIIFLGGLAGALLASWVTAVLVRRRRYVLRLVDQRTAELVRSHDELESARAQAEAANRSKSEFLSRMSHELRTPLNAVLGFAQLLELDDLNTEQREAVTHIVKGGAHLLDLINEVLDISRIETGNMSLSAEPVPVSDLFDEAVDLIRPLGAEQGIDVRRAANDACVHHVQADRQRLKQVLLNLLANAVKYNRAGGSVTVGCQTTEDGSRLRLMVTDTGPGIPLEKQRRLFVPFDRLGAEQTAVEGTGIGLTLSRHLAEAMGGTLDLESTPGQGSTFWVELPLVEDPVEQYERTDPSPVPDAPESTPARTLLYIEDNLANLRLVERILERRPEVTLISAMQGRIGIQLAQEHRPAAIMLDLHLPDTSGEEVLRDLVTDERTRGIPIIMVTADATPGQGQKLLALGAQSILTKPINVQQLLDSLDSAIEEPVSPG